MAKIARALIRNPHRGDEEFTELEQEVLRLAEAGTPQEVIERTGLPEDTAKAVIQEFIRRGVLIGHSSSPGQLVFPVNIGNLKEFNANWPDAPKELFELMQGFQIHRTPGFSHDRYWQYFPDRQPLQLFCDRT